MAFTYGGSEVGLSVFLSVLLKPFVAFLLLLPVLLIAALIHKYLPDGKLRRILFRPLPGHKRRWH